MPFRLLPIFFISGVAGLTFETLWFRLAGLSLGNSVWSASLVLAAFMAGLTLGNGLVARFHSRVEHPIRLYARLELAIGVVSFLVVLVLPRPLFVYDLREGRLLGSTDRLPVKLGPVEPLILAMSERPLAPPSVFGPRGARLGANAEISVSSSSANGQRPGFAR